MTQMEETAGRQHAVGHTEGKAEGKAEESLRAQDQESGQP
jgi:hypothetical protein